MHKQLLICLLGASVFTLGGTLTFDDTTAFAAPGPVQDILIDFFGFSIAPEPAAIGDNLEIVGVLNENTTTAPLDLDFDRYEYTIYMHGLKLAQVVQSGVFIESHYDRGTFDIYRDASFNAPFNIDTDPSAVPDLDETVVPAHFKDGQRILRFKFLSYITVFAQDLGLGTIAFAASELKVTSGQRRNALRRAGLLKDWHIGGGFTNSEDAFIPAGYAMRYDALLRWQGGVPAPLAASPIALAPSTWGRIKATFDE